MDIRRLGTRSLANLAYAYLLTGWVEERVAVAEETAAQRKVELDRKARQDIVAQAVRDFDTDLALDLRKLPTGVDPERVSRARENVRALAGLMQDIEQANTSEDQ